MSFCIGCITTNHTSRVDLVPSRKVRFVRSKGRLLTACLELYGACQYCSVNMTFQGPAAAGDRPKRAAHDADHVEVEYGKVVVLVTCPLRSSSSPAIVHCKPPLEDAHGLLRSEVRRAGCRSEALGCISRSLH